MLNTLCHMYFILHIFRPFSTELTVYYARRFEPQFFHTQPIKTQYKVRERVVEIQYTREILRESESLYSDTSGSTWQSSGPPNYNLLHAVCYTTRTRGEEEDMRWREDEETTHTLKEET